MAEESSLQEVALSKEAIERTVSRLTWIMTMDYIMKFVKKGINRMRGSEETQEDKNSSKVLRSAPTANSSPAPPPHHDSSSKMRVSRMQRHQLPPRRPQPYMLKGVKKGIKRMGKSEETQEDKNSSKVLRSAPTANSSPAPPLHHDSSSKMRVSRTQRHQLPPRRPQPYILKGVKKGIKRMGRSEETQEDKNSSKVLRSAPTSNSSAPSPNHRSAPTTNSSPAPRPHHDSSSKMRVSRTQCHQLPPRRPQPDSSSKMRVSRKQRHQLPPRRPQSNKVKYVKKGLKRMRRSEETQEDKNSSKVQHSAPTANSSPAPSPNHDSSTKIRVSRKQRHQLPLRRPQPYIMKGVKKAIKRMGRSEVETQEDKNSSKDQLSAPSANSSSAPSPNRDSSTRIRVSRKQRHQLPPRRPQPNKVKYVKKGIKRMRRSEVETQEDKNSSKDQRSAPTANSSPAPPPHHDSSSKIRVSQKQRHQLPARRPQPKATRAKKEIHLKQSTRSRPLEYQRSAPNGKSSPAPSPNHRSAPTANSSPAPPPHHNSLPTKSVSREQLRRLPIRRSQPAEETFVEEDVSYGVQKKKAATTRAKKEIHSKQFTKSRPPEYQNSSSTMNVSQRKRRRLPPRRPQPHRPLSRSMTRPRIPVTRAQGRH